MSDDLFLDCSNCWREWTLDGKSRARERFEVVEVYREGGIAEAAVCWRCGSLMEPLLSEVNA